MSVWIVRELVEIEELLEHAERRTLALSMKLVSYGGGLDRQATTAGAKAAVEDDVRVARDVSAETAAVSEALAPLRNGLARAIRSVAELLR